MEVDVRVSWTESYRGETTVEVPDDCENPEEHINAQELASRLSDYAEPRSRTIDSSVAEVQEVYGND